ncbi:DUF4349 domain-containing protein [Streptomonospora sediminis]
MFAKRATPAPRNRNRPLPAAAPAPLALLAVLLLAALAGCSSPQDSSGGNSSEALGPGSGQAAQQNQQDQDAAAKGAPAEEGGGAGAADQVPLADRDLVHTADLEVEVEGVQKAAGAAADWTESAGGYVAAENVQTADGSAPRASLTLHVPKERYEEALDEFAALGSVSSLDRTVSDVTEQVADVDSRVESAEASLKRLRDLLDEAESVDDVLAVEEQISTRQGDLEALQARQESLAQQTSYSTVRLDLAPPSTYVQESEDDSIGFVGGLQRGWQALVAAAQVLAAVAGWLLPFLAVIAVVAVPAWLLRRRRKNAQRRTAAAATAADAGTAGEGAGDKEAG